MIFCCISWISFEKQITFTFTCGPIGELWLISLYSVEDLGEENVTRGADFANPDWITDSNITSI